MLLDAYGALLTERQRQCLSLFYEEDLSLSEIGEAFAISRQAVHDAIRHGEAQLHEYEAALHLVAKENQRQQMNSSTATADWRSTGSSQIITTAVVAALAANS